MVRTCTLSLSEPLLFLPSIESLTLLRVRMFHDGHSESAEWVRVGGVGKVEISPHQP